MRSRKWGLLPKKSKRASLKLSPLARGTQVPRKLTDEPEYILAHELSLAEWLAILSSTRWEKVHPHNCFPTDEHKKQYLAQLQAVEERQFRSLLRHFLNKSTNYGRDAGNFMRVIEKYGDAIFNDDVFVTEFDRRSIPKNGPQWEGITWVLDLLPHKPSEAVLALQAFIHAHFQHFTDNMDFGHHDAIDLIKAMYKLTTALSCFISYGSPDQLFAQRLYDSLTASGIQAFFFPEHAVPGQKLHRVMREGVNQYDRVILICSKSSLTRSGVLNELTETLQREARDGGKEYLIPIRLDDFVFGEWKPDDPGVAQAVRDRVVADFAGAQEDQDKYIAALQRLVTALHRPLSQK